MKARLEKVRLYSTCLALLLAGFCLHVTPLRAVEPHFGDVNGLPIEEWTKSWWKWIAGIPAPVNPLLDETGAYCGRNQPFQQQPNAPEKVYFLANMRDGIAVRQCRVRPEMFIFFPIVNTLATEWEFGDCGNACFEATVFMDEAEPFIVTVDGDELSTDLLVDHRVQSEGDCFTVGLPEDNIFEFLPGGEHLVCSDGYWVMLPPPDPGFHVIHFEGDLADGSVVDVTYEIFIPSLEFFPAQVDFGSVFVGGATRPRQVTVTNRGPVPVSIEDISINGMGFQADPPANLVVPPGGNVVITVFFTPDFEGAHEGVLVVDTTAETLRIPLRGFGVPISFELDFGELEDVTLKSVLRYDSLFEPQAQGWSIGLQVEGDCNILSATVEDAAFAEFADETGFILVDEVSEKEALSSVVLSSFGDVVLPWEGIEILLLQFENIPTLEEGCCTVRYRDGLQTSKSQVINNLVTFLGEPLVPSFSAEGKELCGELSGRPFVRGDSDADNMLNITDGIVILNFLFLGTVTPPCEKAADVDDSGGVNISDGVMVFNFLFTGGPPPRPPSPDCGFDRTEDDLSCEAFPPCR